MDDQIEQGLRAQTTEEEKFMAETVVGRLEFEPGLDRVGRDQAIAAERERLAREQPAGPLRERVLVGSGGHNVIEWVRDA